MPNIWDDYLIQSVYEWSEEEVVVYHSYLKRMASEEFGFLANAVAQYWDNNFFGYGLHDAYVFGHIWYKMFCAGRILFGVFPIQNSPYSDKSIEEYNKALAALPRPFEAKFIRGLGEGDGYVKWVEPIVLRAFRFDENKKVVGAYARVKPDFIPLEVGYTSAGTTNMHLKTAGGFARFPYGQNWVHIWYHTENYEIRIPNLASGSTPPTTPYRNTFEFITEWTTPENLPPFPSYYAD